MNNIKTYLLFLIIFSLLGCQSTAKKPIKIAQTPKWILQPPNDSSTYIYGVGDGDSRKSAIRSALADIASKISVNISSEFNNKLTVQNRGYDLVKTDSEKNIKAKSISIKVNNYNVEKVFSPLPTEVHVLLKTNRNKLLESYLSILDTTLEEYRIDKDRLSKSGKFSKYKFLKKSEQGLDEFTQNRLVVRSLDSQIKIDKYIAYEQNVKSELKDLVHSFKFTVGSENDGSKEFVGAVKNMLAKENLLASKDSEFSIKVSTTKNVSKSHGFIVQNYLINMTVFEKSLAINSHKISIKHVGKEPASVTPNKVIDKFINKLPPVLDW